LWVQTEEIFAMMYREPSISIDQVNKVIAALRVEIDWNDQVTLAERGAYFDHHGFLPEDADAIVMETYAADYYKAAAARDFKSVERQITEYADRVGVKLASGSLDEALIGRSILLELGRSCEASATLARSARTGSLLSHGAVPHLQETHFTEISALDRLIGPELADGATQSAPERPYVEEAQWGNFGCDPAPSQVEVSLVKLTDAGNTDDLDDSFKSMADLLARKKKKSNKWSIKTDKQATQTFNLLDKFMKEERGLGTCSAATQKDLAAFVNFMDTDIYKHYGKSPKDGLPTDVLADRRRSSKGPAEMATLFLRRLGFGPERKILGGTHCVTR
jgi:hypothetical protein